MPNEVVLFSALVTLFILIATPVTIVLWRWNSQPLPASLIRAPLSLRVQRLFHASAAAHLDSRGARGDDW